MLRAWIATTGNGWVNTLRDELTRVLERPVRLNLEPALARIVPIGQRIGAAARLKKEGWSQADAERLAGLS